jgi:hypothetical protein
MSLWPVQTQGGEVNSVAISGDGKVVVAGTYYFRGRKPTALGTYAFDAGGKALWKDLAPATDSGIYWVAVSRDGQWAASGGGDHQVPRPKVLGKGYVSAFEVASGTKTTLLAADIGGVNMTALSGDGSYLVAGADATYVFKRLGSAFGAPSVLSAGIGATDSVVAVAISDDGTWVLYGTSGGRIVLSANKAVVPPLAAPVSWNAPSHHYIKSLAMAADGSGFAVVTTNRAYALKKKVPVECNAYFFSLKSGPDYFPTTQAPAWPGWPLTGCNGTLSVAINGDASRVAAVGNVGVKPVTGSVFFFDAQSSSSSPLWTKSTQHGPNCVSMDDAGKKVAAADGFLSAGAFYLFDALGTKVPLPIQPAKVSWTIQVSADGTAMAAGTDDSKVYYFQ